MQGRPPRPLDRSRSAASVRRYIGDIALSAIARGVLGLVFAGVAGLFFWFFLWRYVQAPAATETRFIATLALLIGIPEGLATAIVWRNAESPRRVRWAFAAAALLAAVAAPYVAMQIRGVQTYHALFGGSVRLPVIDVADALGAMIVSSALAANAVAGALAVYRMARYREI